MTITTEFVVFVITILGVGFGAWWRIESVIKREVGSVNVVAQAASAHSQLLAVQLAEYKTHVAETYITKAGLHEFRDEVMVGVRELKGSVSNLHERIDQLILAERRKPDAA